jgi:lysophospholipase L1-like esterase
MATILLFGSSIPYGLKDYSNGGWGTKLRILVDSTYPKDATGKDNLLYNLGISGDTTTGVTKRFKSETEVRMRKDVETVVLFSIGGNDAGYYKDKNEFVVPLDLFEANYRSILNEAKGLGCTILATLLIPVVNEWAGESSGKPRIKTREFQQIYEGKMLEIFADYGVTCIDTCLLYTSPSPRDH